MKYYNKIQKRVTPFRFRIKTEGEFIKQFGENWFDYVAWNESGKMDYLFGVDLEDNIEYNEKLIYSLFDYKKNRYWLISYNMLIENTSDNFFTIYNNKKQLVYE